MSFICAIQYERTHAYRTLPWDIEQTYVYDGQYVYTQGSTEPISDKVLAKNAHYGAGGGPGPYENKSILMLVKKHYGDDVSTWATKKPLEFFVSHCGN